MVAGQVANNPKFIRAASKALSGVATGVETAKAPKNIFRNIEKGYGLGKAIRLTRQNDLQAPSTEQKIEPMQMDGSYTTQNQVQQKSQPSSSIASYAPKVTVNIPKKKKTQAFGGKVKLSKSNAS